MKKNYVLPAVIFLMLFGMGNLFAQPTSKAVAAKASIFKRIELSRVRLAPCEDTPRECAINMVRASDEPWDGQPDKTEIFNFAGNKQVVILTFKIKGDDSVAGTRYRVEFRKNAGKLEFVQLGVQYKCARGRKGWSKALCS